MNRWWGATVALAARNVQAQSPVAPAGVVLLLDRVYVERRNEREAEHSLHNLKELIESAKAG